MADAEQFECLPLERGRSGGELEAGQRGGRPGLVAVVPTVRQGYDLDWHIGFGVAPGLADYAELNDHLKVSRGTSYKL